jgi:hypothetical protein
MQFTASIISFFAALGAVQAISIPRDSVDGLYTATQNPDGTPGEARLVTAVIGRSPNPAAEAVDVLKRAFPNPSIGCPGNSMDKNAYGTAYNNLNNWCNAGNVVPPNTAYWWISGSTIAYSKFSPSLIHEQSSETDITTVCNYGGNNPCSGAEFRDANILIDNNCGTPNGGVSGF